MEMGCQCSKITYLIIPQKPLEIKLVNSQVFFNVLVIFIAERERRIFNFGLGHTCRCTLALSHLKKFQMKSFQLPAPCDCEKTQRASKMKCICDVMDVSKQQYFRYDGKNNRNDFISMIRSH